jgi:streptomycin 6-kinase
LNGGSEALVAHATAADGSGVIVKIGVPGPTGFEQEVRTLLAANGHGYVQLLRHDTTRRVMLQERLGPQLAQLQLPIRTQIEIICTSLRRAWIAVPDDLQLLTGSEKARNLGEFIAAAWNELGRPCTERAVECALAFAEARRHAFDPAACVLVHGDAHSQNTLQIAGADPSDFSAFKFVDPDGMRAEPALDLAAVMRDWSDELLAGDTRALGRARCELIGLLTGVATEPIWQWGFMERMSTGLYLMQLGWHDEGRGMLKVADAWAV